MDFRSRSSKAGARSGRGNRVGRRADPGEWALSRKPAPEQYLRDERINTITKARTASRRPISSGASRIEKALRIRDIEVCARSTPLPPRQPAVSAAREILLQLLPRGRTPWVSIPSAIIGGGRIVGAILKRWGTVGAMLMARRRCSRTRRRPEADTDFYRAQCNCAIHRKIPAQARLTSTVRADSEP